MWPEVAVGVVHQPGIEPGHSGLAEKDGDWRCLICHKDNVDKEVHIAGQSHVGAAQQVSYALDELKKKARKLCHDGITIKD
jgi:hypothetical protein